MPAYEHHFTPLHPPPEGEEHSKLEARGLINFQTNSQHQLHVRFLCLREQVRVIAITIPEAATSHPDRPNWMKQIVETAITALRLSVDPEAAPIVTPKGFINLMYESDDPEPKYPVKILFQGNPDYRLNINHVLGVYGAIANKRLATIAALLAEGQVPTIPPHYRVLSLIRAIEIMYEPKSHRNEALDGFEEHFAALGISGRPFRSALPEIRARCAHGRSRGRTNPEPYVGIGYNEVQLHPLLELLRSVLAHGLSSMHSISLAGVTHWPPAKHGR